MFNLENEYYNPRWFEAIRDHNIDKFKRYLQHLAHKKVTFGKMKAIFDKLGVNIEDISMLGYPDIKEIVFLISATPILIPLISILSR